MASEKLKTLRQKKETIKGQISNFKNFLEKYRNDQPDPIQLNLRIQKLKSAYEPFDDIQEEIELIDSDTPHIDLVLDRYATQDNYLEILADGERLLITAQGADQTIDNTSRASTGVDTNNILKRRVKLPQAALPTFGGRYEEWLAFKDAFTSLIHNQTDLSSVEKLQYLKSALQGEAARKISVLSITEENYTRAWELLEKTYEDKRLIISRHLSLLLRLPVQEKQTAEGLIKLADETQQHVLSLASLGVKVSEEIIVQNLEEKLHKTTAEKWDETLQRNVFPKLDEMLEFLYRTAARLSQQEVQAVAKSRETTNTSWSASNQKNTKLTFLTSTTKPCPACRHKTHPVFRCEKFRSLLIPERMQIVQDASLCPNCMRHNHKIEDCKFGNCMVCNKKHNTLLHQEASSSRT